MEVSRNLKHIWQRVVRGHDDSMYWSLDMTLTVLIREMLEEYYKFIVLDDKELTKKVKSQREYIEEVIQAFKEYEDITYNEVEYLDKYRDDYKKYEAEKTKRRERLKKLFDKNYDGLWW